MLHLCSQAQDTFNETCSCVYWCSLETYMGCRQSFLLLEMNETESLNLKYLLLGTCNVSICS